MGFRVFLGYLNFLFFIKIIPTFLFETDFLGTNNTNYHLFSKKNSKVCTQLRIFKKEIKSTLNQELMHILGERG
jgi:hypothetical protein